MSYDHKKRVMDALLRNSRTQLKSSSPKRKNSKPEKLVEAECLVWMRKQGWDVAIYESKATYNPKAGRYISAQMKSGTSDCMGTTQTGIAVYIEFKAKGRLSTFANQKNGNQQDFLISKINHGAFACVVDSAAILEAYYIQWSRRRVENIDAGKQFLIEILPRAKKENPLSF